jgi:hypothetical protein
VRPLKLLLLLTLVVPAVCAGALLIAYCISTY